MNRSERRSRRHLGHSIRSRLTLMCSLVIGLIALGISLLYPSWHEKQKARTFIAKAHSIADITSFFAGPALSTGNIPLLTEAVVGA